jgi:hypothetical protein
MSPGVRRQWLPAHSETKHRRMLERSLLRVGDPSWDQGRLRQDSDKNAFSSCPPMMWEHPWPGTYWLLVSAASRPRISSHSSHPVSCPFASQAAPGTKRTEGAWGSKAPKLLISSHLVPAWEDRWHMGQQGGPELVCSCACSGHTHCLWDLGVTGMCRGWQGTSASLS